MYSHGFLFVYLVSLAGVPLFYLNHISFKNWDTETRRNESINNYIDWLSHLLMDAQ